MSSITCQHRRTIQTFVAALFMLMTVLQPVATAFAAPFEVDSARRTAALWQESDLTTEQKSFAQEQGEQTPPSSTIYLPLIGNKYTFSQTDNTPVIVQTPTATATLAPTKQPDAPSDPFLQPTDTNVAAPTPQKLVSATPSPISVTPPETSTPTPTPLIIVQPNHPPTVTISTHVASGPAPLEVNFAAIASDPDGDGLNFEWALGNGATVHGTSSFTHVYHHPGVYTATVTVGDGAASVNAWVSISVSEPTLHNQPPAVNLNISSSTGKVPVTVNFTATASDPDNDSLSYVWTFGDGATAGNHATVSHTYTAIGVYTATVTVSDGELSSSAQVFITAESNIPILDPAPVDLFVTTTVYESTKFLYTGLDPVQTGIVSDTIEPRRAAVVRGRVRSVDGQPMPGVTVTIHNHPVFGSTISRADGYFDLVVNGGGYLTVNYARIGYLTVQRQVHVPWQDFALVDDVVMSILDPVVTTVDLTASVPMQVSQGSVISDSDGIRQSTLLIPQGTRAEMVLPNGVTQTLTTLNLRATEYTVGDLGPNTMPGSLPPESGYTYAVELSVDEALAAGATDVRFSQPLYHYVENFLDFPVGMAVPTGYYDRQKAAWIPSEDGRIVQIMTIVNGLAELDTNGDSVPDNDPDLGITNAERVQLAQLYRVGTSLWRVPISHFTPWDHNWPFGPPPDAQGPPGEPPKFDRKSNAPCEVDGSIIECESQVVGQRLALVGTPFTLNYRSDRTSGRIPYLKLPVSGESLPESLKEIQVYMTIAGVVISATLPALPNQVFEYEWNGLDAYSRQVQGARLAAIRVRYLYDGVYKQPIFGRDFDSGGGGDATVISNRSFGRASSVAIEGSRTRQEIWLERNYTVMLDLWHAKGQELGGWSLNVQHGYDMNGQTLYLGDGRRRNVESVSHIVEAVAGSGKRGFSGDGGPAQKAQFMAPNDVAVGFDGALYIADASNRRVRYVAPDGTITTLAGTGTSGYSGDGGPAAQAQLSTPTSLALAPDGSLYVGDLINHTIRRIGSDGIIKTVAGTGSAGYNGDNIPATEAQLYHPQGLAIAPDGSLYIADTNNNRIRRVGTDGIITTVAGTGWVGYNGDNIPAIQAQLWIPKDVAIGPDGSIYIADWYNNRVRRVTSNGFITTVAGNGSRPYDRGGDGGLAVHTAVGGPLDIEIDDSSQLFILHAGPSIWGTEYHRIRFVDQTGTIHTLAGGFHPLNGDTHGKPATTVTLNIPMDIDLGPDGALYYSDSLYHRIHRLASSYPNFDNEAIALPSEDGSQLHYFSPSGRHSFTLQARTGKVRYKFGYNDGGQLIQITDGDGNVTTIERDASGIPVGFVGPYGQRTTLTLDANGYVSSLVNPAGERYQFTYTASGLMTSMTDPLEYSSSYAYDHLGRLTSNTNALGHVQTFSRVEEPRSHTVTRTSALGETTGYPLSHSATGASVQGVNAPTGGTASTQQNSDGTVVKTDVRGNTTTTRLSPDPRWGMKAPYVSFVESKGPDGTIFFTMAATRTVTVEDPKNLLTLLSQTDLVTVNGRTTTTVYDAATRTVTTTDPVGLVTTTTLDEQGRPLQIATMNLAPVIYIYDDRGRLSAIQEGSGAEQRITTMHYDALSRLQSVTDALGNVTTYSYDAAGRITSKSLPSGQVLRYSYDAAGNLISATNAQGVLTTFAYDAAHRLTAQTIDPIGRNVRTEYVYDAEDNLLQSTEDVGGINRTTSYTYQPFDGHRYLVSQITDPLGSVTSFGYTPAGDLASVTDPLGRTTTYSYTVQGWLAGVTAPGGLTTLSEYNSDGQLVRVTDPRGGQTTYAYDTLGRMVRSTAGASAVGSSSALSLTTDLVYDINGRTVAVIDPQGQVRSRAYDTFSRVVQETDPLGNTVTYTYDKQDRLVSQTVGGNTPAEALTTAYAYDSVGRLLSMTVDPTGLNLVTQYRYSQADSDDTWNLQEAVDPKGNVIRYRYNSLGLQESVTDALGQTWRYTYDNLGRLREQSDPLGRSTRYTADKLGRTVALEQDGRTEQWRFAADGLLSSYTDFANQTTNFTYDGRGWLIDIDYPGTTPDVTYTYDAAGNVTSMNDGLGTTGYAYDAANRLVGRTRNGRTVDYRYSTTGQVTQIDYWGLGAVDYSYNSAGQMTSLTPWDQSATSYSYRSTGALAAQHRSNGVSSSYTYDSAGRLTRLLHATSGATLDDINYVLDANGNRIQMADNDGFTSYVYDAVNRLTQVTLPAIPRGPPAQTIDYRLDAVGNRTSDGATSYTYDASDRITNSGFSYDANGNLLRAGLNEYQYDGANRLTRVISGSLTVNYAYDGWGNLILEASGGITTEFVLDELSGLTRILGEVKSDGSTILYAYGAEGLTAQRTLRPGGGDTVEYALLDGLGSVRHLTDGTGAVVHSRSYDVFGRIRYSTGTSITRLGFTGELHDPNTGLVYLRARHYHPVLGRFLQRDSYAGSLGQPQSLHRYGYVENNPANLTDPSGHCPACAIIGGAVIGGGIEYGTQVYQNYRSGASHRDAWTNVNWWNVGYQAAGGAVGGLAGYGTGALAGRLGGGMLSRIGGGILDGGVSDVATQLTLNWLRGCNLTHDLWQSLIGGGLGGGLGGGISRLRQKMTREAINLLPIIDKLGELYLTDTVYVSEINALIKKMGNVAALLSDVALPKRVKRIRYSTNDAVARGHGAELSQQITIPDKCSAAFWCFSDNELKDDIGRAIEENRAGDPLEFFGPGDIVNDHILFHHSKGSIIRYSSKATGIIIEAEAGSPVRLSDIFAEYPNGVDVRWAACRICITK